MKRIISLLLSVCLCVSLCALLTACGSSAKFEYKLSDDGSYYIITKINITEKTETLDIPAEYEGKPVKALTSLEKWTALVEVKNNHERKLKSVNIPNSIRFIDGLYINEGCTVTFGDYSGKLVSTSTFKMPEKGDYNNLQDYTFYDFSIILFNCNWYAGSGSICFPENVALFQSDDNGNGNSVAFDTVTFAGKLAPYQKGDGSNGWDDVTVPYFVDFRQCKTLQLPEVAAGKGYIDLGMIVTGSGDNTGNTIENLILSKSVNKIKFIANGLPQKTVSMYWEEVCTPTITFSDNITRPMQDEYFKMYVYSETQPTDTSVQYWHYVDGVPTSW